MKKPREVEAAAAPTDSISEHEREGQASLSPICERLPGGIIVAKPVDPMHRGDDRVYELDIYAAAGVGAKTVRVRSKDCASAIDRAKAEPWIRILLYPQGQRESNHAGQDNGEQSENDGWPFSLRQRLAGGSESGHTPIHPGS
jgi:hypothetical protein